MAHFARSTIAFGSGSPRGTKDWQNREEELPLDRSGGFGLTMSARGDDKFYHGVGDLSIEARQQETTERCSKGAWGGIARQDAPVVG